MHEDLLELVDHSTRARLVGASPQALRDLDITALDLPSAARDELRRLDIRRVADLETVDLDRIDLTDRVRESLRCVLLYPKHDPGPGCEWERLFEQAPVAEYVTTGLFHTRFGPVFYRGRLDGTARVLVVGQDPSTDETLAGRILVGASGQRTQGFLNKIGITRSYLMLNTFLFGIQSTNIPSGLETQPTFTTYRNRLFDRAKSTNPGLSLIVAFGAKAHAAVNAWPGRTGLSVVEVKHPVASGVAADWKQHLSDAASHVTPEAATDLTPYPTTGELLTADIPRRDLPFGLPSWHGTGGGTQSQRLSETQISWTAP